MHAWFRFGACSRLAAVVIGFCLWGVSGSGAEEATSEALARVKAKREREARVARELVPALGLNRGQAKRLLPIVEEAAELHLEAYEQQARLLPQMLAAFSEFARQDSLNQGFTREVERRTARLNHQGKQVREKLVEELAELAKLAGAVLTDAQRARLESLSGKRRAARGQARESRRAARNRFRARRMGRQEQLDERLRAAWAELEQLYRQTYGTPELGPVGRFLLHPAAAEPLCRIVGVRPSRTLMRAARVLERGTSEYPIETRDEQMAAVLRLRGEISNWNLINGLYLTRAQIERIVGLYDAAAPRAAAVGRKAGRRAGASPFLLVSLERSVEQIMNRGQREVVADFKTCLIPPKNLKDPVRVGQANDFSRYEKWLVRARKAQGRRLTALIDRTLAQEAEHLGPLGPAEQRERKTLLLKTARQVAKLSDAEFELNKAELAESIAPRDRKKELKDEIASLARERGLPGPVARFLLKPQFIEQLRLRGRQLAEGTVPEPADLAAGPQAENCEKGCAIDGKKYVKKNAQKKK